MLFILSRAAAIFFVLLAFLGIASLAPTTVTIDKVATTTPKATTKATTTPIAATTTKKTEAKPVAKTSTPKITLPQIPVTIPIPVQASSTSEINTEVRKSIVNILCITQFAPQKAITGTGVIIDSRGVILTNAHIAEFYLLRDFAGPNSIDCTIRTGSPAAPEYKGELLFISAPWIEENKNNLKEETPLGTGENDFAFILITKHIDGTPVTETFPALTVGVKDSDIDRTEMIDHIVAAYPAGFLGIASVERELYIASAVVNIHQIFTFKETTIDLISIGGNVVAQRGASGGAVVSSATKKLVGLIVTTTDATTTGERDLRAITLSHVERSLKESTGKTIAEYLAQNLNETLSVFQNTLFPPLATILKNVLNGQQ